LIDFSEQQLIDCNTNGSFGCRGGQPIQALNYIAQTGGIDIATTYPNTGTVIQYLKKIDYP